MARAAPLIYEANSPFKLFYADTQKTAPRSANGKAVLDQARVSLKRLGACVRVAACKGASRSSYREPRLAAQDRFDAGQLAVREGQVVQRRDIVFDPANAASDAISAEVTRPPRNTHASDICASDWPRCLREGVELAAASPRLPA